MEPRMLDLLASGQNKLSDPILMKWALRRFQHAQTLGSERCHDMERAWFHDISLRHWIDSDDHDVLADLFYVLPSRLFVNLRPAVPAILKVAAALIFGIPKSVGK
jgi:hypothetical protein